MFHQLVLQTISPLRTTLGLQEKQTSTEAGRCICFPKMGTFQYDYHENDEVDSLITVLGHFNNKQLSEVYVQPWIRNDALFCLY